MKHHCVIGANTLEMAVSAHPEAQFLTMARDIALTHHEDVTMVAVIRMAWRRIRFRCAAGSRPWPTSTTR